VPFLALSFALEGRDPDETEALCFDAGALSVTLTDEVDDAILEPAPGELRLWPRTRVQALFAAEASDATLVAHLAAQLALSPEQLQATAVEDRVWEREWLKDYHAMRFGRRLWVTPRHEQVTEPGAVVVRLDPGLAFGTGTHPSTGLCLQYLDSMASLPGARAIDYGCGSGVLAVAAAKLGAARVDCFDIDPQALLATAENAADNDVGAALHVHARAANLPQGVDLLLANIISGTLCALAGDFAALLRPGGTLVLAGILDEQAAAVTAAHAPWFDVLPFAGRDGWTALAGTRRS
jgi:ribosomal protein L11 methyltransferase